MDLENFSQKIRRHIGSPEGLGKAKKEVPSHTKIIRKVLTRDGSLEEKEISNLVCLASGLASIAYKGNVNGKEIVEKLCGDLPPCVGKKSKGKTLMEGAFLFFRQSLPSFRTNFYAAMSNHYASLIIEEASELEFGESITPKIQYTSYDKESGGFLFAYEFIAGRNIRPGPEEKLLIEKLKIWKSFIADKLGMWGIGRQCDVKNINSPGNVFIVNEKTKKMKLLDITPGVIGGQIYFLPLEYEYFFKGLLTGNFLPFGDAVDTVKLDKYEKDLKEKCGEKRLLNFQKNCKAFKFFLEKWRDSEPALLRSPFRIFQYLFNLKTIKSTTLTAIVNLEYRGIINTALANAMRKTVSKETKRITLTLLRIKLFIYLLWSVIKKMPSFIYLAVKLILIVFPLKSFKFLVSFFKFLFKAYTDKDFRKKVTQDKIGKWIRESEENSKMITPSDAKALREELKKTDVLEILELQPLWTVAKIIKPPFVGTAANLTLIYLFTTTLNPYWLLPLFLDGFIRFVITLIFAGLKYKLLLFLSIVPTFGFVLPVPAELIKRAPFLTRFLMRDVIGAKMGTMLPGVDRHSFRTYFYIHLMDMPFTIANTIVKSPHGLTK